VLAKLAPSLAALALVTASGIGIQALLPAPLERSRVARVGLAFLLGTAWLGLGAWALGFAGAPLGRPLWLTIALGPLAGGAVAYARRRNAGGLARAATSGSGRWALAAVVLVVAAESVALLAHTTAEPVADFDGRMTWGTQARYLEASGDVLPSVLRDKRSFVIHPRYPILLPLLQVATVQLAGLTLDSFAVRPLYVLFLPAFAAALWPALRRAGGTRGAAVATLLLFGAPLVLVDRDAGPLGTYSDFPLAGFLGIGVTQLLHPRARREPWRGWIAGLLLAAAAGAKNEAMLLAPAALALFAWPGGAWRAPRRAALVRAAGVVGLALILFVAWRSRIENRNDEGYFETFSVAEAAANLPARIGSIAATATRLSFDRGRWGFLFWIVPAILIAGASIRRRRDCRVAGALVAAQLAIIVAAYSVVGDPGIVDVTWNRFVLQAYGPLALLAAAASSALIVQALARSPAEPPLRSRVASR
jgi:hypothetical protein